MSLTNLYVLGKCSGRVHRVGDSKHDGIWVDNNGVVNYYNLQDGDGCSGNGYEKEAGYAFLPSNCGDLEQPERCLCGYHRKCNYPIDRCYECPLRGDSNGEKK